MKTLDLFSGIGGFALAGKMVGGFEVQQFVEIDPYCQKVLAKNFPKIPIHDDIQTYTAQLGHFDCITAGFPCQDISQANPYGLGLEGCRSGLFYKLLQVIREVRPRYVVLENVAEMLRKQQGRIMGAILYELSQSGYDAEWDTIPASFVGANHLRERTWIVAYSNSDRRQRSLFPQSDHNLHRINSTSCEKWKTISSSIDASVAPHWPPRLGELGTVPRANDGISGGLDKLRRQQIKALGNAVVPQCAAIALQRVLELERLAA